MNKKLIVTLLGSASLIGMSTQASALETFTVDPNSIPGNVFATSTFDADSVAGTTSGLISLDAATGTATESGWVRLNSFALGATGVGPLDAGLNIDYQLYLTFDLTASLTSGTFGANGSMYNTSLSFEMYADPTNDTTFSASGLGGVAASVTDGTADSILLGSGMGLGPGTINGGGVALNSIAGFGLTAAGEAYFIDPDPFFDLAISGFNNTATGVDADYETSTGCLAGTCELAVNNGTASFDFQNTVPEPTTIALLGMGILGFSASRRRK